MTKRKVRPPERLEADGRLAGSFRRLRTPSFLLSALAIAAVDRTMPQGRPRAAGHDGRHIDALPPEELR